MEEPQVSTNRTPEEVAWDREFADDTQTGVGSNLRDLLKIAVRIPSALLELATDMVPDETVRHTRAAARESFLAVRSLLSAVGDNIEEMLSEPGTTGTPTVKGPGGTWGTGRAAPTSSSKARRIDIGGADAIEPAIGPDEVPV